MAKDYTDIELRSEKVRNITGKIPPVFVRYGITIIAITLFSLFAISLIIPYRETVELSITIYSEPNAQFIKSPNSGKIIIPDTLKTKVEENTILAYIQENGNIYPVHSIHDGNIIFSVKNEQFIEQNDIAFIIISANEYETYGIAEIDDISKIKMKQIVEINVNKENIKGIISDIYVSNLQPTKHKIKIDFIKIENINIHPSQTYNGLVVISEKNIFEKIFK
jgi:hypothetical protein